MELLEGRRLFAAVTPLSPPAGSVGLTGTVIGTPGSYQNDGDTAAKAFDGDGNTFFDAPAGTAWVGLDLGAARSVTQVQLVPRAGYAGRMVGGTFQASNTADFSSGVTTLYTVKAVPAAGRFTAAAVTAAGSFRYVRYLSPAGGHGNVAELAFAGRPAPFTDVDIGSPAKAGSATTTAAGVTVAGGGADIWNQTDQFNFDSQPLAGNGTVVAQVTGQTDTDGWAKAGVMVRETADADSRFVLIALTPGNGVTFKARTATHSTPSVSTVVAGTTGVYLRLARSGSTFTGSVSTNGVAWTAVGSVTIPMVNDVLAGPCVTAHDDAAASTATFAHLAVTATGVAASVWSDAAPAPLDRWESETFTYDGELYLFGGFDDRNLDATAECDVYDPATDVWSHLTTVPTGALTHASVAVVGTTAYFAGGDLGTFAYGKKATATSEVLTYNLATNAWGKTTSLPAAVSCGGLAAVNNHLYYYGGLNATDTADLSATWGLDLAHPAAGWVAEAAMPDGRNHLGSAVINGLAYAVGGSHLYNETKGNDAAVDAYNPVTNKWTAVASLPQPWGSNETTTLTVNGKIVLIGGQTNGGYDGIYLNAIEAYDPAKNAWAQVGTLPEANEGESAAYVDGRLIVAQGTVDNLGGWSQDQTWVTSAITL